MTISFQTLLTDCLDALGDRQGNTWSRIDCIMPWAKEAIRNFPILRPNFYTATNISTTIYDVSMPVDFREVVAVEYPVSQTPPVYLVRKNHFDPNFYDQDGFYDVDRDYENGKGYLLWISSGWAGGTAIHVYYLATHDTNLTDSPTSYLTVPDQYEPLLITAVMCRAYRERLGMLMQDPTAFSSLVDQLTNAVGQLEQRYDQMLATVQVKITDSTVSPRMKSDKFDRLY